MNRESYDLDLICYFAHGDVTAGITLREIYENVEKALAEEYFVERRTSALRLYSRDPKERLDYHIDVVPGRYTDKNKEDVFLCCCSGDKERLKTNLDVHIRHIRDSGVTDAIRLLKLWRVRNNLSVRTFVLELLAVELLKSKKSADLTDQLSHFWTELRDRVSEIVVLDPANPAGNDLSDLFGDSVKQALSSVAARALDLIKNQCWQDIFGDLSRGSSASPAIVPSFTVRPRGSFGA